MRFLFSIFALGLFATTTSTAKGESHNTQCKTKQCDTLIDWIADPQAAFTLAERTGKPLFVFHLSGNLLRRKFT